MPFNGSCAWALERTSRREGVAAPSATLFAPFPPHIHSALRKKTPSVFSAGRIFTTTSLRSIPFGKSTR